MPYFPSPWSQVARKRFNLKRLRQQKVPFIGPILLIAAQRDSGHRLVQIHIQLAPTTEAIWVLCFSHGIFIFKTLLLEIEMSTKVLKRVESSLLLQSRPGKSKNLWIYIYMHVRAHRHTHMYLPSFQYYIQYCMLGRHTFKLTIWKIHTFMMYLRH